MDRGAEMDSVLALVRKIGSAWRFKIGDEWRFVMVDPGAAVDSSVVAGFSAAEALREVGDRGTCARDRGLPTHRRCSNFRRAAHGGRIRRCDDACQRPLFTLSAGMGAVRRADGD